MDQKLRHRSQFVLTTVFFNFGRKKIENLRFKNGHFSTICGHFLGNYIVIFHKTEIQTVILRCLVYKNIDWIKSYNKILVKIFIFLCLKMHHFRANLPKWVLTPQKETNCHIFKIATFSKLFGGFMAHIIRQNADKRIKYFFELFTNKFFEHTFVSLLMDESISRY